MAYDRSFGQNQVASPWSSGVPPGLQQQQVHHQMFNQPMGAFDVSGAWQGQQGAQQQPQWVQPMQQVQFVPNRAFMPQQPPMAPPPRQPQQNRQQHHQQQQGQFNQFRQTRQQARMNKGGQFNNINNHNNNNHSTNNRHQQQQQQHYNNNNNNSGNNNNNQQQQKQKPTVRKVKVTKQNIAAKLTPKLASKSNVSGAVSSGDKTAKNAAPNVASNNQQQTGAGQAANNQAGKTGVQSKTAERKQLKLQARKNAEALKQSKLPVAKANKVAGDVAGNDAAAAKSAAEGDEPIDQAQLKCVPAVFGFVCKLCDVFLRDKNARREHIDSDSHMEKFKTFQEEQDKAEKAAAEKAAAEQEATNTTSTTTTTTTSPSAEKADIAEDVAMKAEEPAAVKAEKSEEADAEKVEQSEAAAADPKVAGDSAVKVEQAQQPQVEVECP